MGSPQTEILEDNEFKEIVRSKSRIARILTGLTMIAYFSFIGLLAFKPSVLATVVASGVNLGIPLGIGVIVWSWLLTGVYVRWANTTYDDGIERMKSSLEAKLTTDRGEGA